MADDHGQMRMFGFFQNHWIQADAIAEAFSMAREITRADKKWKQIQADSSPENLQIRLFEWKDVDSTDDVGANPSGYNFYLVPRWWEFWKRDWWTTRTERNFIPDISAE